MWTSDNLENDSRRCIEALLRAVPASSRRILDVGCGDAQFGARLKEADGSREVFGIACDPASVDGARQRLDQVYTLDIQTQDPPIEPGTLDCIIYAGVLEHLIDPQEVLRRHRSLLKPQGVILCCIPNVQHHSLLAALLKGDVQSTSEGLREPAHLRFFTYFTFFKLLLDAGFTPSIADTTNAPCPKPLFDAIEPLLHYLGVDWGRMQRYLGTYQYIFRGMPLPYYNRSALAENGSGAKTCLDEPPLSFVVCVSNDATLKGNLLSSPCLAQGSAHEL